MKTLFKTNDEIRIDGLSDKLIIIDFEIFDDVTLYYTNDGKAYPEDKITQSKFNTEIITDYIISGLQSKESIDYDIKFFKDLNERLKKSKKPKKLFSFSKI